MIKDKGLIPRLHGNGFIQLDLNGKDRLHVWHPDLPKQEFPTPIHDHKFSFKSHILYGELTHIEYHADLLLHQENYGKEWNPYPLEQLYHAYNPFVRENEDTILKRADE